jgi:pimeloyl-ACP methyl ester carboxylesterase
MPVAVSRHYVTVDGRFGRRQVHYRRAGSGPALLLLHQSPQSSRELVPLLAAWGEQFTCIAPDTPGYGCSDALGVATASLDDFAAAVMEFCDAVGVARAGVYGFHTGGMIGIALGHRYPERIAAVAANGVAVLDAEERARILADYLPPVVPRWDGSHLAWAWARCREQTIFVPWHWRTLARRMDFAMPGPAHVQQSVLELLRAGDSYHVAYRAAFLHDSPAALRAMVPPALITASPLDPLAPHLARIGPVSATTRVGAARDAADALERCRAHLAGHAGEPVPPPPAPWTRSTGDTALRRALVPTPVGAMHLRWSRPAAAGELPVLLLHEPGASSATWGPALAAVAAHHAVLAPDLPGHGESDPLVHPDLGRVAACITALLALLDAAAAPRVRVFAGGFAAVLALALAEAAPGRVAELVLAGRATPDAADRADWRGSLAPETVEWHGGHLLRYWHTVRDGRLYAPWFRRDRESIRWVEPDLDEPGLQRDVLELMKAAGHWQELLAELVERSAGDPLAAARARGVAVTELAAAATPGAAFAVAG